MYIKIEKLITMLTLVIYPHPMLQRACRSLTKKELAGDLVGDRGLKDLVNEMLSMMVEKKGVGLAAPQVGLPIRLLVMMGPDGPLALANPRLENVSKDMVMGDEGCLSTPGLVGQVRRFREVIASGEGFDGGGFRPVRLHLTEMFARIFQHEHDHLGGILFLKRAEKVFNIAAISPQSTEKMRK
jgi:peptide deformylase